MCEVVCNIFHFFYIFHTLETHNKCQLQPLYLMNTTRMMRAATVRNADILQRHYHKTNTFTTMSHVHMWQRLRSRGSRPEREIQQGIIQISVNLSRNKRQSWLSDMTFPPKQTKAHLNSTCVQGISRRQEQGAEGETHFNLNSFLIILSIFFILYLFRGFFQRLPVLLTSQPKAKQHEYKLVLEEACHSLLKTHLHHHFRLIDLKNDEYKFSLPI